MVQTHTTWPKSIPHGQIVCPYIPHDTYHVICQQPFHILVNLTHVIYNVVLTIEYHPYIAQLSICSAHVIHM